jgi:hypothetical protein
LVKNWLLDRPYFESDDLHWVIAAADATKRIGIWLKETSVYTPLLPRRPHGPTYRQSVRCSEHRLQPLDGASSSSR